MTDYGFLSHEERAAFRSAIETEYETIAARGLSLNMARGKPSSEQLDLSNGLLAAVSASEQVFSQIGTDGRNYGVADGLPEAKELMAALLDDAAENTLVCGNSSLNIMYDTVARCWCFGALGSTPWGKLEEVKWICPSPGYDRHFGVTEDFGIRMIPVPMTPEGPDMDEVERIAASDPAVKGIWCVPKYSNPDGITYSDAVVRRLAAMPCAAEDFRIFWDNAYCVHHLYDEPERQDRLADIGEACRKAGNPHRYYKFASTSKITFPGAGISAMAASPENLAEAKKHLEKQTIGHDKLNQLRHVRFLRDAEGIAAHMAKHAALLRPKFELVDRKLKEGLQDCVPCSWSSPKGGYFVSFNAPEGTAKRIVALAKEAGVTMTGAGASFPYKRDPKDSNIRIAPTLPPLSELDAAMDAFVCCVKLAYLEQIEKGD